MSSIVRLCCWWVLILLGFTAQAKESAPSRPLAPLQIDPITEAAARLQVFLDRSEFAPGKIDGSYGEFTLRALALYRQSKAGFDPVLTAESETPSKGPSADQPGAPRVVPWPRLEVAPDVSDLDLTSVGPLFRTYSVTAEDLKNVGPLPAGISRQAKLKYLPYRDSTEAIAEKFHCAIGFLQRLNPGIAGGIKVGDVVWVPNVEPFELEEVKHLEPGSQVTERAANELEGTGAEEPVESKIALKVDTKTKMLTVYESGRLIAAYPVTVGSAHTASPIGEWTVREVAKMPNFRYDQAMLHRGVRSGNFYLLPPGPNNMVGIMWIQLNKDGVGLHGTNEPETIGRSVSHGCVRLANWDVVRLAKKVKVGVPVSIH